MHFWSVLTTTHPAINQFLYYSALLENFMQSKTSSKQATTVLVNRTTSTSGALERDGCIMCCPNPLKQPCSNFREKLNLLLYVGETLLYTLSFQTGKSVPKCSSEVRWPLQYSHITTAFLKALVSSEGLLRSPTKRKM